MSAATKRHSVRFHFYALLGYFVLALVVTYPTILHFTTQIPGELIPDRNQDYWNLWWITQAVARHTNPFHTDMLYYPYGAPLYYHILGLTQWLIGLGPQLLWGYAAADNTVIIAAFTLSGYGAFRLALFVTGKPLASFLGGVVFGFTPYTLASVSIWQNENTSIQWIPFYAEAWLHAWQDPPVIRWRPLALAGVVFALATYTTLYYSIQLLIFTVVHLIYVLATHRQWRLLWRDLLRATTSLLVMGAVALPFMLPLLIGLAQNYNNPRVELSARGQMVIHSADLFSFVAFPHDHPLLPLLGTRGGRFGTDKQEVPDNLTLGWVALSLAVTGAVVAWHNKGKSTPFWVAFGLTAMVLAMGPQLKIGGTITGIPMPFGLLAGLPGIEAVGKVYRLVPLTRCAMAVLAAWGAAWLVDRLAARTFQRRTADGGHPPGNAKQNRETDDPQPHQLPLSTAVRPFFFGQFRPPAVSLLFACVLSLLLFELPLNPRYIEPFNVPPGYTQLAAMPPGGLMELPFATQQSLVLSERMISQTVHEHPIMSGYLSRNYISPIVDWCSPFWGFIAPLGVPREGAEIASPLVVERPADVLSFYNIRYLALYTRYGIKGNPVPDDQMEAFHQIISHVDAGTPFYSDDYATLYTVPPHSTADAPASFHIGAGWYGVEQGWQPYRWLKDGRGTLCVFAPHPMAEQQLVMESTAFGAARHISIYKGSDQVFAGTVPTDTFTTIITDPIRWEPGVTEITITVAEPGTAPRSVDPNLDDDRLLTVLFRKVRLVPEARQGKRT